MLRPSDIPNVTLGDRISGGSFGEVYRGHHATLDVEVAVKILKSGVPGQYLDSALTEARLMARLDHPNLLRIFDAGRRSDGVAYLVMELMDGTCAGMRRVPADEAFALTLQLLAGLQALHDARVLHRDIKPANCLVRKRDRRVKLADLGIAVEEVSQSVELFDLKGTLPFMAPELFAEQPRFSAASDLYALGVTMQCMVLESDPFPYGSQADLMAWILGGAPPRVAASRPDLPRELSTLIEQMSARAAGARPSTAAEALARLTPTAPVRKAHAAVDETVPLAIGPWVLGAQSSSERGNFREYAVTHVETGAAGRLRALQPRRPLSEASALIIASATRASRLNHAGIVDVVDWGMHDGRAYVVTRPQGQRLETLVESAGPFRELEAVELTRALADAIAYLHGVGLVYQVVNPGFAVLSGDARSAQLAWPMFCVPIGSAADPDPASSLRISVPRFAAPESLVRPSRHEHAAVVDPAPPPGAQNIGRYEVVRELGDRPAVPTIHPSVDLYGLGETLYFLIAGRPAYSGTPEMTALVLEKMRGPAMLRAAAPGVTAPTAQLVAELTAPDPKERPASAAAVRDELDRIAARLRAAGSAATSP